MVALKRRQGGTRNSWLNLRESDKTGQLLFDAGLFARTLY